MAGRNNLLKPGAGFIKPLIIAVIVIGIAWLIGKGVLTLVSSVK